jgi:hypothetical protein
MSSLSLFRLGEIVSFAPLKTRSVSALIADINCKLSAIITSCVKSEFTYYLKRFCHLVSVMEVPAVYLRIACDTPVDRRGLGESCDAPLYGTVGSPLEKGAAISRLGYRAESCC